MTDQELADFNSKQIFVRDAMPSEWLGYSEELAEAAEVLWTGAAESMRIGLDGDLANGSGILTKSFPHPLSYLLLIGFALENALKAMAIAADPTLINSGSLDKKLKTHDLLDLSNFIGSLTLSDSEKELLSICSNAIPYWSRYPVPLTHKKVEVAGAATPQLRAIFLPLHYRLCETVYNQIKDGWDSGAGPRLAKMRSVRYGDTWNPKEPFPWVKDV